MLSKDGKLYYNDDEKQKALSNNNALEYAMSRGYNLVKEGSYYTMREHDSMVFSPDGKWSWNSRGIIKGSALDFIQSYEGKSNVEAVLTLAGTLGYTPNPIIKHRLEKEAKEKPPLKIPERSKDNEQIRKYLVEERCISAKLFDNLFSQKKIYQSRKWQNVVMVGFDKKGNPQYISERSTNSNSEKPYKLDATGSNKSFPFIIEGNTNTDTVVVLESPIEAMSYHSICELTSSPRIHADMISLGGVSLGALDRYLSEHPNAKNIIVATNNDRDKVAINPITKAKTIVNAGKASRSNIFDKYGDKYDVSTHLPHLNDWNDVVKNIRNKSIEKKLQPSTVQLKQQPVKSKAPVL